MSRKLGVLLFFILITQISFGLEVKQGLIKLVLHEHNGRFSLYYLESLQNSTYTSCLFEEDPSTSFLSIVADSKIYKMGESSDFKEETVKTENGAKFVWTSNLMVITEEFTFITSKDSSVADGIKINLSIVNRSNYSISAGARYLLDTYLGEGAIHFKTDLDQKIDNEKTLNSNTSAQYWISPADEVSQNGLKVIINGTGITKPDAVIFANWSRLKNAGWDYETSSYRNFSASFYSANDSAVCQIYNPQSIPALGKREIVLILGMASKSGFSVQNETGLTDLEKLLEQSITGTEDEEGSNQALLSDITTLENLINQINKKLKEETIKQSDINIIRQLLDKLKKKYNRE